MGGFRLAGGMVAFPDGRVEPGVVDVVDGRIEGVFAPGTTPTSRLSPVALTGFTVLPGFLDIHVNGGVGETFEGAGPEGISRILKMYARFGTTALVGALNTAPNEARIASLERLQAWKPGPEDGVEFLGVYLEGPYYHPRQRGAHPVRWMHDPDPGEYRAWFDRFGDLIRVFSLAPERPGAVDLIRELRRRGIVAAAGHSMATGEEMERAMEAGLRLVTHLYCAQSTFSREGSGKRLGVAEMGLWRDELTVEIIPDGHHLPPRLLALILKVKRHDRICLTTDAMHATGLGPGRYELMGRAVWVDSEVAYREDRKRFAGSILTMDRGVRTLVEAGVPIGEVARMASTVPAETIGVADRKGKLARGYDADLVVMDDRLEVNATVCRGRVAYAREGSPLRALDA